MAKRKSARLGSRNFFTLVVLSVSALGLMFVTYASQQKTNTQSDAAGGSNFMVRVVYDSNGNQKYDEGKDDCYTGRVKISFNTGTYSSYNSSDSSCVYSMQLNQNTISRINAGELSGLFVKIDEPRKEGSFVRVIDKQGTNMFGFNFNGESILTQPIENGETRVVFGLKGRPPAAAPAPNNNQQPINCGKPSIIYNGSKGGTRSVTYRFTVENNCNKTQTYRAWAVINDKGTSGWNYKFAQGNENQSVKKVIPAGKTSGSEVEVSRAKNTPSGSYNVTFYAAPCDNPNNCDSNRDTNDNKRATYTTTYRVEN